jgi:predicted P-loop ATPase
MASPIISLFPHIRDANNGTDMPFDVFLHNIKSGAWSDHVLDVYKYRSDPLAMRKAKESVPYVTISGKFKTRKNEGLEHHSGFLAIDIDEVDPRETKEIICCDKHVYAAFASISGGGLCVIFKINPAKHLESFEGLQQYLYDSYKIIVDPSCKDVSRPRYVSYDAEMYLNERAEKFVSYVKKDKALNPTKVPNVVFVEDDFNMVLGEIAERGIDITGSYQTWLRIGFSIADKFGEQGREAYHAISRYSTTYLPKTCDRQYDNCLKSKNSGVNIATFYFIAKAAGLCIISERTRKVSAIADAARRAHSDKKAAVKEATEQGFENATDIINQVFDNSIDIPDASEIESHEFWLKEHYSLRRNELTRYIESSGEPLQKKDFNTIWVAARKVFDKISYQDLERLIDSDSTPTYNPLKDFIHEQSHRTPTGCIEQVFRSIETDTGDDDFAVTFGTKWFVGMIASIYGKHSPLMLVFTGPQNSGKTEFWRRLLPVPLLHYYAESKLDQDKDSEILMTQKLIIMNDEMGGATAKDEKRIKELTSKQVFSLREPYGRGNVDLVRLAMLGATANLTAILGDNTGNRRIIPINMLSYDFDAYNRVDKTDMFMEAYHLYKAGFPWHLSKQEIAMLNGSTSEFDKVNIERELLTLYYELPAEGAGTWLTATEIKTRLMRDNKHVPNATKLGQELKNLGFVRGGFRRNGQPQYGYKVQETNTLFGTDLPVKQPLPF